MSHSDLKLYLLSLDLAINNVCRKSLQIAAKFKELAMAREDDESHFSITKQRKLISFLEQTISSLSESSLSIDLVLDPLKYQFSSPHFCLRNVKAKRNWDMMMLNMICLLLHLFIYLLIFYFFWWVINVGSGDNVLCLYLFINTTTSM